MDGAVRALDADAVGVGGAAMAMGGAVSDSLGGEKDCEPAFRRGAGAMGRRGNGGGDVYAAGDGNGALPGGPTPASAHAGNGDDFAGDLANPGSETVAGCAAAVGGV